MAVATQTATMQPKKQSWPAKERTQEAVRECEGKIVKVVTDLISHMSEPQRMLCAGTVEDGKYLFLNSVKEELDGRTVVQGLLGWENYTFYEEDTFRFYNQHEQYPFTDLSHIRGKDLEHALKLWRVRQK